MTAPAPTEPARLDYQSAPPSHETRPVYVSMPALLGATFLFAAGQWIAEYACQSLYHLRSVQPGTFAYVRALERREDDMMIETVYIAICSAAFLIVQGVLRPSSGASVRPHAWLAAAGAGVTLCLTRWLIGFAAGYSLSEFLSLCIALSLTIALATAVSFYRWPGIRQRVR